MRANFIIVLHFHLVALVPLSISISTPLSAFEILRTKRRSKKSYNMECREALEHWQLPRRRMHKLLAPVSKRVANDFDARKFSVAASGCWSGDFGSIDARFCEFQRTLFIHFKLNFFAFYIFCFSAIFCSFFFLSFLLSLRRFFALLLLLSSCCSSFQADDIRRPTGGIVIFVETK